MDDDQSSGEFLLLHDHPQGIIVDCARLENVTEEGAQTFLEAMRDIESIKARIVVANLPENVMAVLRTVPGVRSQLPIADSVDAARASLRVAARPTNAPTSQKGGDGGRSQILLVPLLARMDLTYGAHLAARLARAGRAEVRLIFFLEIARNLPVNAPLADQEQTQLRHWNAPSNTPASSMSRPRNTLSAFATRRKAFWPPSAIRMLIWS